MIRTASGAIFFMFLSLVSGNSYGDQVEEQNEPGTPALVGYNVEASITESRDVVNLGFWTTLEGRVLHAGLFTVRPKEGAGRYGVDIGMGYLSSVIGLWPFWEIGVKLGVSAGITNLNGEAYPKIGIAVPVIHDQMLLYASYLYSVSTQGRHADYSAASIGIVWAL